MPPRVMPVGIAKTVLVPGVLVHDEDLDGALIPGWRSPELRE